MNYLQFDFETESAEQLEQLVALLNDEGFEGFEEEDHCLKSYISETKFDEESFSRVLNLFSSIIYTRTSVENINWNQKWEQDFKPVVIDDFVAIRAGFHLPVKGVKQEIIITPKMSFGTGHHATTYLMVQQMNLLDFTGRSVLDFGTGTGVLAILAEKLGATNVLAIDYDEWSITNTRENIGLNNCSKIEVALLNEIPVDRKFDIVLANINLNVIVAGMSSIATVVNRGGQVLLSGFLKENEHVMIQTLESAGLRYAFTVQKGDWITILAHSETSG